MAGLLGRWVEDFKKGWDEAHAERGTALGSARRAETSSNGASETGAPDTPEDTEETRKLLAEVTELAEQLQKRITELETERDDAKKRLDETTSETDPLRERVTNLEGDIEEKKKLIDEMAAQLEPMQKRLPELEGERDLFVEVLQIPGVRKLLLKVVLPDAHPDADEDQIRLLTAWSRKVNAAYELIGRKKQTSESP